METIESWKDEEWKLEVDVSEVKYNEIKSLKQNLRRKKQGKG